MLSMVPLKEKKMFNTQRMIHKSVIYLSGLVLCLLTSGCSPVIRLYSPEELIKLRENHSNYATLSVGDRSHLMVDGKLVFQRENSYGSGDCAAGFGDVHIRILPGLHKLEWSLSETRYNPAYKGSCDLDVKSNAKYYINYVCEGKVIRSSFDGRFHETQYNVIDTFTWISEEKGWIKIGVSNYMPVCGKVAEKSAGSNCLMRHDRNFYRGGLINN
jgi:hypothetical protein